MCRRQCIKLAIIVCMIKNAIALIAGVFIFHFAVAQRIVKNIMFFDLDDNYNVVDSGILKNGLRSTICLPM